MPNNIPNNVYNNVPNNIPNNVYNNLPNNIPNIVYNNEASIPNSVYENDAANIPNSVYNNVPNNYPNNPFLVYNNWLYKLTELREKWYQKDLYSSFPHHNYFLYLFNSQIIPVAPL